MTWERSIVLCYLFNVESTTFYFIQHCDVSSSNALLILGNDSASSHKPPPLGGVEAEVFLASGPTPCKFLYNSFPLIILYASLQIIGRVVK